MDSCARPGWPSPKGSPGTWKPEEQKKRQYLECSIPWVSKQEHLNLPQEVLGLEPCFLQKTVLGDPTSISRASNLHCTNWDWRLALDPTAIEVRMQCLLFSHFKSGAVRTLVLQIWVEKQDMWLGGLNQKLKHLTTGELITLAGNPFRF